MIDAAKLKLVTPDKAETSSMLSNIDLMPEEYVPDNEKTYYEKRIESQVVQIINEIYNIEQVQHQLNNVHGIDSDEAKVNRNDLKRKRLLLLSLRENLELFLNLDPDQQALTSRNYQDAEKQGRLDGNGNITTRPARRFR